MQENIDNKTLRGLLLKSFLHFHDEVGEKRHFKCWCWRHVALVGCAAQRCLVTAETCYIIRFYSHVLALSDRLRN